MPQCLCNHVHLYCRNLEDMIAYWSDVFGARLVCRRKFGQDDGAEMDINMGTTLLYLKTLASCAPADSGPERCGLDHFGVEVDDMDSFLKTQVGKPHVALLREPFLSATMRCAFISGPEGTRVEIMERRKD